MTQKVNGIISWKYFASSHEKCVVDGIRAGAQDGYSCEEGQNV